MCFTFDARPDWRDRMGAVTHVDGTARIQTVDAADNPLFFDLLGRHAGLTGDPLVLNTSFNLNGQPIVETPRDALMTFFGCGLDDLIIGPFHVVK